MKINSFRFMILFLECFIQLYLCSDNIFRNNLLVIRRDKGSQGNKEKANMNKIAYWHSENM